MKSSRSAGAKKAWTTIRSNQQKRSNAAKKANETRGAKGRRNAALKAWETIRGRSYDPVFDKKIRKSRPDWF